MRNKKFRAFHSTLWWKPKTPLLLFKLQRDIYQTATIFHRYSTIFWANTLIIIGHETMWFITCIIQYVCTVPKYTGWFKSNLGFGTVLHNIFQIWIKYQIVNANVINWFRKTIVQFGSPCKYVYVYIGMPISLLLYSEYFNKGCWMYFQKNNMYELTFVWFDGCNDKKISYGTHYNQDCVCND